MQKVIEDRFGIGETRDDIILAMRDAGIPIVRIGAVFGLSRERVSQIAGRGRYEKEALYWQLIDEFEKNDGRSIARICQDIGVLASAGRRWLTEHVGEGGDLQHVLQRMRLDRARRMVQEFVDARPGVPITAYNLFRHYSPGIGTWICRMRPAAVWRREFGQPVVLSGRTTRRNGDFTRFLESGREM